MHNKYNINGNAVGIEDSSGQILKQLRPPKNANGDDVSSTCPSLTALES
jgi:hypothetical protein